MRFAHEFRFDERPEVLRIANESSSVERTAEVATAPHMVTELSFVMADSVLPSHSLDAVWRSGAMRDPVPGRVEALEAVWFDSAWGSVLPVAVERWSGCDVVTFRVGDPERFLGMRRARIDMIDGSGFVREGVPHGCRSGAGGMWARMAYPTD